MSNSSTITLAQTMAFCQPLVNNLQLNLNNGQPFLGFANTVAQWMICEPLTWRFNRNVSGFVCQTGVQNYALGNWTAGTQVAANFNIVDPNGNSQRVTTAGTTGATSQPSWNTTLNGTTSDGTSVWTNVGSIPLGTSTFNYGFTENIAVQDIGQSPAQWFQIQSKRDLSPDSAQSRPMFLSDELEDSNGNITFRCMPVPDKAYPVQITAQKKFVPYTSINQTWGIPDQYVVNIVQHGCLAYSYLYRGNTIGFRDANQKFIGGILGAQGGLNQTEKNIWLQNYMMGTQFALQGFNAQRDAGARGV